MPCYLMTHPEHGQHICYTPEDVEAHKAIGWVLQDEAVKSVERETLTIKNKPGRKPKQ